MKNSEVVIMGLGYIGLPTSAVIASHGINVLGVDINEQIVDTINDGKIHINEPGLDNIVLEVVSNGFLKASKTPTSANTFLIVVPTPFKENNEPDTSYIEAAVNKILSFLKKGDLVIIESTSPVGITSKIQKLIYESRADLKGTIYIAYCPERVLPGNIINELIENDRVIGGVDEASTQKAKLFYSKYVKGELHGTNAHTAEMCKLVENSSRDVQIAFANELSIICDKANINVWELIKLANMHPRVKILNPGCGVGGHCIAVDPYFITSKFPLESKIISAAREINNYKAFWCYEKIQKTKLEFELDNHKKPTTALMGLAFKPDVDDLRESPAKYIAKKIKQESNNEKHYFVEPNIDSHKDFKLTNYEEGIKRADIIVFLVAHKEFKNLDISSEKIVLDFCGIFK